MGGKSQAAPDYSAMAAATKYGVEVAEKLGNRQMDFAQRQYDEQKPYLQNISDTLVASQKQQMEQAKDYYDYNVSTFRPLEQGLVKSAQEYNTEGNRQMLAAQAAADAQMAFQGAQSQTNRDMARRGINPSSGAALMMRNQNAMGLAGATAGAATGARRQAEATGYSRLTDAASLGRGLAASSTSAYGGATSAGTAGANTSMAAGNQYSNAFGQGAGYAMGGAQMGISGAGSILNSQTSTYNTGVNSEGQMYGALLGAAATYKSDRRLKNDIKLVGVDERSGLNLYEFTYKGGSGDKYIGVMADEAKINHPEAVFTMPDGFDAVNYEALGIEFKKA
jgi:hypothetical protein